MSKEQISLQDLAATFFDALSPFQEKAPIDYLYFPKEGAPITEFLFGNIARGVSFLSATLSSSMQASQVQDPSGYSVAEFKEGAEVLTAVALCFVLADERSQISAEVLQSVYSDRVIQLAQNFLKLRKGTLTQEEASTLLKDCLVAEQTSSEPTAG